MSIAEFTEVDEVSLRIKTPDDVRKYALSIHELFDSSPDQQVQLSDFRRLDFTQHYRLGAVEESEICQTCGQRGRDCLGHFSHVQLPVPVYHPLFLRSLQPLLRASCCTGSHLRASKFLIDHCVNLLRHAFFGNEVKVEELISAIAYLPKESIDEDSQVAFAESLKKHRARKSNKRHQDGDEDEEDLLDEEDEGTLLKSKNGKWLRGLLWDSATKLGCSASQEADQLQASNPHILHSTGSPLHRSVFPIVLKLLANTNKKCQQCGQKTTGENSITLRNKCQFFQGPGLLRVEDVRAVIRGLWTSEPYLMSWLYPFIGAKTPVGQQLQNPHEAFFIRDVPITPYRFRMAMVARMKVNEHTAALHDLMTLSAQYSNLKKLPVEPPTSAGEGLVEMTPRELEELRVINGMQQAVNSIFDSSLLPPSKQATAKGIRQLIEKKKGLLRLNMMSARVNQSCRTVISPDPFVETNEIVLPVHFAQKLTFPENLAPFNLRRLQQLVRNGPKKYPGAARISFVAGPRVGKVIQLDDHGIDLEKEAQALAEIDLTKERVRVERHVQTGDWSLFNRQPSLHRASMMGHRVRVLSNWHTLRFHYVNCKSYNADFDGDEMNVHIPQSLQAQVEAKELANADHQYIVPTSGKPLRGLIQDAVSMGVLLTARDSFFDKEHYMEYVYHSLHPYLNEHGHLLPQCLQVPCVLKPKPMWSGKQLISTAVQFVSLVLGGPGTPENPTKFVSLYGTNVIPGDLWSGHEFRPPGGTHPMIRELEDSGVVFRHGQLLKGIMDGRQVGAQAQSIVHAVQEIYGDRGAALLLGALSRLFGKYLRSTGMSCGIADMLLQRGAQLKCRELLVRGNSAPCRPEVRLGGESAAQKVLSEHTSEIGGLYPKQMLRQFPHNNLQLMTLSGAKGSKTNATQMGVHLGQQTFAGKRIHDTATGRSLPAFVAGDHRGHTKAWVRGKYLTGISPTDYFIHSIAGRDGLIDTAVKTSSSGYLQRCLIKGLEGLVVSYDRTVKDAEDQVIQFRYGEDGLDPCKSSWLDRPGFFADNLDLCLTRDQRFATATEEATRAAEKHETSAEATKRDLRAPVPSEAFERRLEKFVGEMAPDKGLIDRRVELVDSLRRSGDKQRQQAADQQALQLAADLAARESKNAKLRKKRPVEQNPLRAHAEIAKYHRRMREKAEQEGTQKREGLQRLLRGRCQRALCDAGEAVGLLAAQGIGEPSTQMTLNTFHHAGASAAHVVTGIPRLRQLLMTGKVHTATVMVPIKSTDLHPKVLALAVSMVPCYLANLLDTAGAGHHPVSVRRLPPDEDASLGNGLEAQAIVMKFNPHSLGAYGISQGQLVRSLQAMLLGNAPGANYNAKNLVRLLIQQNRHVRLGIGEVTPALASAAARQEKETTGSGKGGDRGARLEDSDDEAGDPRSRATNLDDADATAQPVTVDSTLLDETELALRSANAADDFADADAEADAPDAADDEVASSASEDEDEDDDDEEAPARPEEDDEDDEEGEATGKPKRQPKKKQPTKRKRHPAAEGEEASVEGAAAQSVQGIVDEINDQLARAVAKMAKMGVAAIRLTISPQLVAVVRIDMRTDAVVTLPVSLRRAIENTVVRQVRGVNAAGIVRDQDNKGKSLLQVSGGQLEVLLPILAAHEELFDLAKLYTSDLDDVVRTLGAEAAYQVYSRDLAGVFKSHNVAVHPHHISLIADYCLASGSLRAFNRNSLIGNQNSFLSKMTFESSLTFLTKAALHGDPEKAQQPSSRLVLGMAPRLGVGSDFHVLYAAG